jgi:hypothetical protein
MPPSTTSPIHIIFPQDGEAWSALARRLNETDGELLVILSGRESELISQPETRKAFLAECKKIQQRLRIATKHPAIAAEARGMGLRILDRTKHVRALLHDHPKLNDALRVFSPQLWRQQLKSRLQRMGLLSVPKMRIFSLAALSVLLFSVVVFKLLPSAEIHIRPRQESVSQTVNIFLVASGAQLDVSDRVRKMPLVELVAQLKQTLEFGHISKEFIGSSAQVDLTIINKAAERYELREGTRFSNQAGMIFRIQSYAVIEPNEEVTVGAVAEDTDLYGELIGERGNVPAGLRWEIPGLSEEERKVVYAENKVAAKGGTSAYRTVMRQEDLDLAKKKLEQDLLIAAQNYIKNEVENRAERSDEGHVAVLNQDVLVRTHFQNFVFPTHLIGQEVTSIPVEGEIIYKRLAYDSGAVLDMLRSELISHTREGRRLIQNNLRADNLDVSVIEWDDSFRWVKITVGLTGTEEYILDPLSPTGALFGKKVRELVVGVKRDEALRIIRNLPEVERVEITQWPPWNRTLPDIASHISIVTQ